MGKKGVFAEHRCLTCGIVDATQFFGRQKTRCKKCQGVINEQRRIARRIEAIEYKGVNVNGVAIINIEGH
jgi:hypothetical protein